MAVVTAEMTGPTPVISAQRIRVSKARPIAATRIALLVLSSIGIAFGPEPWLRALSATAVVVVVYVAGMRDGRADVALDALLRGDVRAARRASRDGAEAEGD